jgi:hypothetical protein
MKLPKYPLSPHQEEPLPEGSEGDSASVIINEVQLILTEKRTSLAAMRTGIAVFCPAPFYPERSGGHFQIL